MEIERARYLVSARGQQALAGLQPVAPVTDPVGLSRELRRRFPPDEASALAEQLTLRARAARNHGVGRPWLYTAHGLEMMTHPAVAARRAERMASWGFPTIDLTAGLGGDLAALVTAGVGSAGVERDPVHSLLAASNTGAQIARGDAARPPIDLTRWAVVLDPARRSDAGRRFDPSAFSPAWDDVMAIADSARAAVVKSPPGIAPEFVPPSAEFEAVQLGGSMREVTLWFGGDSQSGLRRAVLLPSSVTLDSTEPEAPAGAVEPAGYLFDPESCVTRATLVTHLAHRLDARLLDPHIAYLTAAAPAFSPLAATFAVLDVLPFSVSRLKERLRASKWRAEEIRRRAFPVEPDELRKLLGRMEGDPVALLLTTIAGRRTVFICRRLFASG